MYRAVVLLVQLLAEAAAFMDQLEQKLFYFKDGKIEIPIRYSAESLSRRVNVAEIERLLKRFNADALHRAQKLTIVADVITSLVRSQPVATRFEYVLQNVNHVIAGVDDGYRLFVSSFSYDKIRSDLENASLEEAYPADLGSSICGSDVAPDRPALFLGLSPGLTRSQ